MYYVTYYREYSLYEPAEGGYYYPGVEDFESFEFTTKQEAREFLNQYALDLELEQDGFTKQNDEKWTKYGSYIGQSEWVCIETKRACQAIGKQVYC